MAKVYSAPPLKGYGAKASNPFKSAAGKSGSSASSMAGNPMAGELGDPSLYIDYSGSNPGLLGLFTGFAEGRQAHRQSEAFQAEKLAQEGALGKFSEHVQTLGDPGKAMLELLKDPETFMTFSRTGLLDDTTKLVGALQKANGAQIVEIDGTKFIQQPNNHLTPLNVAEPAGSNVGVDENGNVVRENRDRKGNTSIRPVPGVQPPSEVGRNIWKIIPGITDPETGNAIEQNDKTGERRVTGYKPTSSTNIEKKADIDTNKWKYDSANNRWQLGPGATGGAQEVLAATPPAKLNDAQRSYFSNAPNLYKAMNELGALSDKVPHPITGKLVTMAARLAGEGKEGIQWNTSLMAAKTAYAKMKSSGRTNLVVETMLDNLPVNWESGRQALHDVKRVVQDLRNEAGREVEMAEGVGKLPDGVSDDMAKMGVFPRKFTPALSKLRQEPSAMTPSEIMGLQGKSNMLPPEDRAALKAELQKRMATSANQAGQPPANTKPAGQ